MELELQQPSTRLVVMTAEELADLTARIVRQTVAMLRGDEEEEPQELEEEVVWGIDGIKNLFHVSSSVAQKYKNTWLEPAIIQRGRKIMVRKRMALELFQALNETEEEAEAEEEA